MNVMYLCDDSYAHIAGISILSLLNNNKDIDDIHIFLVGDSISKENKHKLYQTVKGEHRTLTIIEKPDIKSLVGCNIEMHWWVENVFSRVFLETVFERYPEVDRVLYIDCDTLVIGNLKDLWELNLDGMLAAGVLEAMGNLHKKAIGLKKSDPYFNAGMFLIDVNKWRKEGYDRRACQFIQDVNGKMEYADESVLNGIAATKMKIVSPKYNLTSLTIYFNIDEVKKYRKPYFHYSEDERQKALKDARVVHFTSTFVDVRPWIKGSHHPYADEWKKYKEISLWNEVELLNDNRSMKKRIAGKLVLLLPLGIRNICAGFIHAYLKPIKYVR